MWLGKVEGGNLSAPQWKSTVGRLPCQEGCDILHGMRDSQRALPSDMPILYSFSRVSSVDGLPSY